MKPYYEQDGITLYHGDCRELLRGQALQGRLETGAIMLTDPPYQGLRGGLVSNFSGGKAVAKRRTATTTVGDDGVSLGRLNHSEWLPWAIGLVDAAFVFCSYHDVADIRQAMPANFSPKALLVWHKPNAMPVVRNVPRFRVEFAWAFERTTHDATFTWREVDTLYSIPFPNAGCVSNGERYTDPSGKALHPAQKPKSICLEILKVGGSTVLDPFAGTGTTLRAAKDMGRRAIGIEMEERYCEIAARRLDQQVLDFSDGPSVGVARLGDGS